MKTKLWSFICILSLLLVPSCAPDNTQPDNPQLTGDPPVIVNESLPTITNTTLSMNVTVNPGNLPTTVSTERQHLTIKRLSLHRVQFQEMRIFLLMQQLVD